MKTSLLIILGLSILAIAWAPKSKKTTENVEKSEPVDQEKKEPSNNANKAADAKKESKSGNVQDSDDNSSKSKKDKTKEKSSNGDTEVKSKKNSRAGSAENKPSKKAAKDDDDISEDVDEILNEDDEEDEEVEIPSSDDLDTESDPIELGEQIKNLTDRKKRRALVTELKKAWEENSETLAGRFYQAAYASLSKKRGAKEKAEAFWNKHLEEATQSVMNPKGILGKANSGLGNALENARKIAQADPVGIALRNGESVLLTTLSDSLKNLGQVTDMAYDATKNTSKLIRAATFPVDYIPILSDIKNNVHDIVEEQADRGKFLTGSFAENGSSAFDRAAKNAKKKADERQDLLTRQFSSTRKI